MMSTPKTFAAFSEMLVVECDLMQMGAFSRESKLVEDLNADSLGLYLIQEVMAELGAPVPADLFVLMGSLGDFYDHYRLRSGVAQDEAS